MSDVDPLAGLLDLAEGLPACLDECKSELGPAMLRWDDFPRITFLRLETAARLAFEAGLWLLRNPPVAYGAEVHLRTLMEAMAHVTWIAGLDRVPFTPAQAKQRAICFDFGAAREVQRLSDSIPTRYHDDATSRKGADGRLREFGRIHQGTGCSCTGRLWSAASQTLKDMVQTAAAVAEEQGRDLASNPFEVYPYLYRTSSALVHVGLFDRYLQQVEPGVTDFVPASNQHRARTLTWLVHTYSTTAINTLVGESDSHAGKMQAAAAGVLGTHLLREADAGSLDTHSA